VLSAGLLERELFTEVSSVVPIMVQRAALQLLSESANQQLAVDLASMRLDFGEHNRGVKSFILTSRVL
jgi:hypothetical protein